jgi:iron complex transport system permease protein
MGRTRSFARLLGLAGIAGVIVVASLFIGSGDLTLADVGQVLTGRSRGVDSIIVLDVRLPRAILGILVGAALTSSGVVFQGLFRNPLADPFVLGVSGGAALGAVLVIVTGADTTALGLGAVTLGAFGGAVAAGALVSILGSVRGRMPPATLVLAGSAVGSFAGALVTILLLMHTQKWAEVLLWTLGRLDHADAWLRIRIAAPCIAASVGVMALHGRDLNLLLMGDETACHLGLEAERTKRVLVVAATFATATTVALCGIIGFVGLIVPHVARSVVGPDHRRLLPFAVIAGSVFLLGADLVARVAILPGGLPVGTVTALMGTPFFLILMRRRGMRL